MVSEWQMLADMELDGVIVATPASTHFQIASHYIDAGLPVLVEKPLAMSRLNAEQLADKVLKRDGILLVNHIHLFSQAYQRARAIVRLLGPIRTIRTSGGRQGPYRNDCKPLWDWGPHDVSMVLDLFDSAPVSIEATQELYEQHAEGLAENIKMKLGFADGAFSEIIVGNNMARVRYLEACCDKGTVVYNDLADIKVSVVDLESGEHTDEMDALLDPTDTHTPLTGVLMRFGDLIRAADPTPELVDFAVTVTRVLDTVQEKLRANRKSQ